MTRTSLPVGVAVVVSAGLLLSACGGGGSDSSDKIQSSGSPSASATASSASPSASAGVKRPAIALPAGAKNVFEGRHTGDAKKDAVLYDNEQWVNSMDEAILKRSSDTSHIAFYSRDDALGSSVSFVKGYLDKKDTWVGTTRFFDRKVTFMPGGTASVVYCSDESKAFIKHSNGKIDNTPTDADSYVLYNTKLVKNNDGVWQTSVVVSDRGAKECQP